MNIITLAQARAHVKADGDDDDMLTIYANAAEKACARFVSRSLFADLAALDAALSALPDILATAWADHDAAMAQARGLVDIRQREFAEENARAALSQAKIDHQMVINGIVASDDIVAAILVTTAFFYRNRDVGDLPPQVQNILAPYRWFGPL